MSGPSSWWRYAGPPSGFFFHFCFNLLLPALWQHPGWVQTPTDRGKMSPSFFYWPHHLAVPKPYPLSRYVSDTSCLVFSHGPTQGPLDLPIPDYLQKSFLVWVTPHTIPVSPPLTTLVLYGLLNPNQLLERSTHSDVTILLNFLKYSFLIYTCVCAWVGLCVPCTYKCSQSSEGVIVAELELQVAYEPPDMSDGETQLGALNHWALSYFFRKVVCIYVVCVWRGTKATAHV